MSAFDLEFQNVSKRYHITRDSGSSGLFSRVSRLWKPSGEFWALRNVSFGVAAGEALGIIGHNGAGKSTALKLMSSITAPTSGEIRIRGRIAALLELGSGFHPELSGRENVYLSGSILGMRRSEITAKLDDILDFAGVREFADTPVKHYSSGMYVRLGFAIAAHLDGEILLLDEVLAVGDAKFQERCQSRILELKHAGRTIVFISHDLAAVRQVCDRVVLLDHGQVVTEGAPPEVIAAYAKLGNTRRRSPQQQVVTQKKAVQVTGLTFFDDTGRPTNELHTGSPARALLEYESVEFVPATVFNLLFYPSGEWTLATQFTTRDTPVDLPPGKGAIEFSCDEFSLGPGGYTACCSIEDTNHEIDFVTQAYFSVRSGKHLRGRFHSPHRWRRLEANYTTANSREQQLLEGSSS